MSEEILQQIRAARKANDTHSSLTKLGITELPPEIGELTSLGLSRNARSF